MAYAKNIWVTGDVITAALINHLETQYDEAKSYTDTHAAATTGVHGVGASTIESTSGSQAKVNTHAAAADPHTVYIKHDLATAANDFLVASGVGAFIKKTLAETKTILGITAATTSAAGIVELATLAEVATGTDTARAVTPQGVKQETDKRMNNTKAYGNFEYTDSINASSTLTKTIALGANYSHGRLVIKNKYPGSGSSPNYFQGLTAVFGTDNTKTLLSGAGYMSTTYYPAGGWSQRMLGKVTGSAESVEYGRLVTGNANITIDDIYINGANLTIVFRNNSAGAISLACVGDWEVW
jgi:hypothetical protein